MDVQAGGVTVHKAGSQRRRADGGASSALPGASPRSAAAGGGARDAWADAEEVEGEMLGLLGDLVAPVTREQEPIISAGAVAVTQDGLTPPASRAASPGDDPVAEALQPHGGSSRWEGGACGMHAGWMLTCPPAVGSCCVPRGAAG